MYETQFACLETKTTYLFMFRFVYDFTTFVITDSLFAQYYVLYDVTWFSHLIFGM